MTKKKTFAEKTPLLAGSPSHSGSEFPVAASVGNSKTVFNKLFHRQRLSTPMSTSSRTRRTVDTRQLRVEKDANDQLRPLAANKIPKDRSPPRLLKENSKDSKKRSRPIHTHLRRADESSRSTVDPPARTINEGSRFNPQADNKSITGSSQSTAESSSEALVQEIQPRTSFGASDGDDVFSFKEDDVAQSGIQHISPLSSIRPPVTNDIQTADTKVVAPDGTAAQPPAESSSIDKGKTTQSVISDRQPIDTTVNDVPCPTSVNSDNPSRHDWSEDRREIGVFPTRSSYDNESEGGMERCSHEDDEEDTISRVSKRPSTDESETPPPVLRTASDRDQSLSSPTKAYNESQKIRCDPIISTIDQSPAQNYKSPIPPSRVSHQPKTATSKTKALLSRPFGRTTLPPDIARKWVVEVSSAEWDADQHRWKYRLLIQSRQKPSNAGQSDKQKDGKDASRLFPCQQSFTTAFTWRSLSEFLWLEKSLRDEYQGALLLPELSKTLGMDKLSNPDLSPVEADRLRNWLGDILNGLRGEGELILDHDPLEILKSESMEAFLYRNSGPTSALQSPTAQFDSQGDRKNAEESLFERLLSPILTPFEFCTGADSVVALKSDGVRNHRNGLMRKIDSLACQSTALVSSSSLEHDESVRTEASDPKAKTLSRYFEVIGAETSLISNYRSLALSASDGLSSLISGEEKLGSAWNGLVLALSNLFAFEKDVEGARIGHSKVKKENIPFRRISKNAVDETLRVFSKCRMERAVPSLKALHSSLLSYIDDLSSAETSFQVYLDAVNGAEEPTHVEDKQMASKWESAMKSLAIPSFVSTVKKDMEESELELQLQREVDRNRFLKNETLLCKSLTTFCHSVSIRVSRMTWRFLNTEATQCAMLHSSAVTLRSNVAVAREKSVAKMVNRHLQEERQDALLETSLVEKILDLAAIDGNPTLVSQIVMARAGARERLGRWDDSVVSAIFDALRIEKSEPWPDQSSREIRGVKNYSVGLQENLKLCSDALQKLREASSGGKQHATSKSSLEIVRHAVVDELSNLFSCDFIGSEKEHIEQQRSILAKVGVHIKDPFGWKKSTPSSLNDAKSRSTFTQACVGDLVTSYFTSRDSRIEWLCDRMSEILDEYYKRVQIVEGFISMECVGLYLERHFSDRRAKTLSAFEKKTDVTAALNVAMKKRLSELALELEKKLNDFGPDISQIKLKETKEAHLASKDIKLKLHELASRRLMRAREASTEKVISIIELVAKEEEASAAFELKAINEAMSALERDVGKEDFDSVVYRLPKHVNVEA